MTEIVLTGEIPEPPTVEEVAPPVVVVAPPIVECDHMDELGELRSFKSEVESERLNKIEADAALALALAQIPVIEEEPMVEPEFEPEPVVDIVDEAPNNEHSFFKKF